MTDILQTGFLISLVGIIVVFLVLALVWFFLELASHLLNAHPLEPETDSSNAPNESNRSSSPPASDSNIKDVIRKAVAMREHIDENSVHVVNYKIIGYSDQESLVCNGNRTCSGQNNTDSSAQTSPANAKAPEGSKSIQAPMPGKILGVNVKKDQQVKQGDVLCVLEAMKMENEILAPSDCRILDIHVREGSSVKSGDLLISVE